MNFLLFQLQRLLMLPIALLRSPLELFSAFSDGSVRSEAFVKGLPAVLVGVGVTLAVLATSLGGQESMVEFYSSELQKSDNERKILQAELQQAIISENALAENSSGDSRAAAKDGDPRQAQVDALSEKTNIYLKKLIKIQPDQREYKYRLALRALSEGNVRRCFQMMKQISPLDTPGYPQAHLQLALFYENAPAKSPIERVGNIDTALTHVEHCLTNDINNLEALKIKARLLILKGSTEDARRTFKKVFEADPKYFRPLLGLQKEKAERKATLLTASSAFSTQLTSSEVQKDSARWVAAWQGYAQSMTLLRDFETLELRLLRELDRYKDGTKNMARQPFLKQYLAQLYIAWTIHENGDPLRKDMLEWPEQNQLSMLDYYAKAFSYNENDRTVLQSISRLAFSSFPSVKEKARQIYDPAQQTNVPPEVLNQMGLQALKKKDYVLAQQHYERARSLAPNNPAILNNLAYAYLKGEDEGDVTAEDFMSKSKSNAERAHDLVAQAMRLIPPDKLKSPNMSMYRHTLGTALMQLKNYAAAAAEFEQALAIRPENVDLLKSVIVCYDNFNLDSTPYRNKLDEVLEKEKANR
jgi:tetratricopeptide (TPR) repeat protein